MARELELVTELRPKGDQPEAILGLLEGLRDGEQHQVLLGITGSGKTFTIANVIATTKRPTLIIAPNKTLAAQLYSEMRELFPDNAVEYFVSYYDYYQPEAYIPSSDTYIEKDAIINDKVDRMRHSATRSLLARRDVIIVASVSCIYGIGSSEWYQEMLINLEVGQEYRRDRLLRRLVDIQYRRNDIDFHRGTFRVRGDVVEIFPAHSENLAVRIEYWGDEIERIVEIDPTRGKVLEELDQYGVYPGSHYVTPDEHRKRAIKSIREELLQWLPKLETEGKLLEKQRLEQRTMYDLEMLEQMGFCPRTTAGICRAAKRASLHRLCSTTFPTTSWSSSTNRTLPSLSSERCFGATGRAKKRWSSTGFAYQARSIIGLCVSLNGRNVSHKSFT
jgi:excinuclease ABC subunit B